MLFFFFFLIFFQSFFIVLIDTCVICLPLPNFILFFVYFNGHTMYDTIIDSPDKSNLWFPEIFLFWKHWVKFGVPTHNIFLSVCLCVCCVWTNLDCNYFVLFVCFSVCLLACRQWHYQFQQSIYLLYFFCLSLAAQQGILVPGVLLIKEVKTPK